MTFNFGDFDLNQLPSYEGESVATADRVSSSGSNVISNMEGHHSTLLSHSDAPPLPLPLPQPQHAAPQAPQLSLALTLAPPQPPDESQAHGQRRRRSDSLDLNSPASQRRRVSSPNQPRPPSEARPPHSFSGQEPQHEVPSEGSSSMEGYPRPFQFTLLQPSGSGAQASTVFSIL